MPIAFKSRLSSAIANATFLDKTIDDLKKGKLGLYKVSTDKLVEPTSIEDVQVYFSQLADASGVNNENDANRKVYSSNNYVANGDDRKVAIGKLDAQVGTNAANITTNANNITALDGRVTDIENDYGQPNGLATLDGSGLVPLTQLPNSLLIYQGTWDASTNTPTLSNGTSTANFWYRVNVAGTVDFGAGNISFNVGDKVVYSPSGIWEKWDTTDEVVSVNSKTGAVVLDKTDIGLSNVTNDAQLKRAAADFNTFTEKVTPVNDDIVLIEDSEDVFNKKKVRLSNMLAGGSGSGAGSLDTIFQLVADEDLVNWSTGNNATFLGGGSLAGSFVKETVAPLNGDASYKYTQAAGSLNDYLASPVQDVAVRFRGQTCTLFFPFTYNGSSDQIQVIFYDVTNASIIPSSVFIQNSPTVSIFKTNITIPTTCQQIRVGYKVNVLSNGSVFSFDDVQLSSDSTTYADITEQIQVHNVNYSQLLANTNNTLINGSPSFNETSSSNNGTYLRVPVSGWYSITATVDTPSGVQGNVVLAVYTRSSAPTGVGQGSFVIGSNGPTFTRTNVARVQHINKFLNIGDFIYLECQTNNPSGVNPHSFQLSISKFAEKKDTILTAPETFSTDTAALRYRNASEVAGIAGLANANVGDYITFTYAANTNTRTQTTGTNRPTQTDADMNQNGIRVFTRTYNASSTSQEPAVFAIQIGKGLKGLTRSLYKNTGKSLSGELDVYGSNASEVGPRINSYNEVTGVLTFDTGFRDGSNVLASLGFSDGSYATNGYLVINASKNPALTGLNNNAVVAVYNTAAAPSLPTGANTVINFSNKVIDTNNAVTIGPLWRFISPESAYYRVSTIVNINPNSNGARVLNVTKNGAGGAFATVETTPTAQTATGIHASGVVFLAKGDFVDVNVFQNSGVSLSLVAAGAYNTISINKITEI